MASNLVIVESPAKAKTIEKFLGKDFQVKSSFGHIADLPSSGINVDVEGDFEPNYEVPSDKKKLVAELKSLAKKADMVWLASDEDREGEAIAWHLKEQLKLKEDKTKRIVFHEITKKAILNAVENPRGINTHLVDAQQARRVLDRLVGYELSPVLWRKIKPGLSAGRVQSVAVRLIVERERDINEFKPVASYKVVAEFKNAAGKKFKASLAKGFSSKKDAAAFLESCNGADFSVSDLQVKPAKKSPAPPFTTSTLQQEASRKLGFSVSRTMMVAQRLYEAGLITYMRTDSLNLSDDAKTAAAKEISASYGSEYSKPRNFKTKSKGAQEAHEAIRPTDMSRHRVAVDFDQDRLYALIWKRTLASQMSEAVLERTSVKISNNNNKSIFNAKGEVVKFDGFLKVYLEGTDNEDEEQAGMLPKMQLKEALSNVFITATERYTKAPPRFTEAALVKKLEELGIGRPSTYAPTISTIQRREYIVKGSIEGSPRDYTQLMLKSGKVTDATLTEKVGSDKGKLVPTDIGKIVNDFLVANFANVLDFGFTAKVEAEFDEIAEGKLQWKGMIKDFYTKFHPTVAEVQENADFQRGERELGKDPATGKPILVRFGRYGAMAQIGDREDEDKRFASLLKEQSLDTITLEEALDLFKLPKDLGEYQGEKIVVANGRFGPYIKFGAKFISLPKDMDPLEVDLEAAKPLIDERIETDRPIAEFDGMPVQKGVGRFGPFLKWNNMFINVNKKYDFDNLSNEDIDTLIKEKIQKEIDKVIHNWEDAGIRVEKARWGRFNIIKGKTKIELPKTTDAKALTLEEVEAMIAAKKPKRKTKAKAKAKAKPKPKKK